MFSEYSGIYRWNPCKSSDSFGIFSDFTFVYCEIHEILNICNIWYPLSNLCVHVSGCWLQEKRGRDHYFVFVFCFCSETINYLLISFIYIVHWIRNQFSSLICFSDLDFRILHKSSIYCEILSNPQIYSIFLRISSLNIVKSLDLLILFFHSLIFAVSREFSIFNYIDSKMVILVFLTNSFVQPF